MIGFNQFLKRDPNPLADWRRSQASRLRLSGTALLLLSVVSLRAESPKPTEYQVKAAYLSNFGKFVQWSGPAAGNTFKVCVLGQDPFGSTLDAALAGEKINHLPLEAKRVVTPQQAGDCRILFISASEDDQLHSVITSLAKASVLTVSDIPEFTKHGGMIEFLLEGNRIRFEVNLAAAQRAGLNLSSELLKLAVAVQREQ
jgi:YfiR/HmsC-like